MSASKKAFDFSRDGNVYSCDPIEELCIIGGASLPEEERGPLDTPVDVDHPLYDERLEIPLTEEFIANVDAYGVLEAVLITKMNDCAALVAGRQRIRAARVVNRRRKARGEPPMKVRAIMQRTQENRLLGVMIAENAARVEDDPLTRIAKLKRLMERGVSIEDAAVTFACSPATIRQYLAFDDQASVAVKRAVEHGKIGATAAMTIARIKEPEKQEAALKELLDSPGAAAETGKKSVRAARVAAKKVTSGKNAHEGVTDKRTQTKMLRAIEKMSHGNKSDRTLAWWEGVEAALVMVLGDDDPDERLTKLLAEVRQ